MGDRSPGAADEPAPSSGDRSIDREEIRAVLADHPVRTAVLFGSQVAGTADAHSDVDIAVELTEAAREDATQVRLELLADLSVALDRNDIDLSLVADLAPRVGLAAFRDGELLVGSGDRAAQLQREFERRVPEQSREDLRERFDTVLDAVDATVGERR